MDNTEILHETDKPASKAKKGVVALALAGMLAVGGALAYLTDSASVTNDFTLDTNLSVALTEPNWDADAAKAMTPTMTVAKDPHIANDGTVSEWVAATVKVPVFTGKMLNDEGKIVDVTDQDLFTYELGAGWTQSGAATVADGYRTYTYVYSTALDAGAAAADLFSEVTMANLTQDVGITDTTIDVTAHAIQKTGFDDAASAYAAYTAQIAAGTSTGA